MALFAANGTLAVEVQEICEDAGIRVPGEVAIVGIDDYLLSVGAANRSVSGVDTNLEEQGYQGAALLDRMMRGAKVPAQPVRIAPTGVIVCKSSDILAVNHGGVARGLHFTADHFAHHSGRLSFCGQEAKDFTYRLCRLNLFIHGLDGDIRLGSSYDNDQHAGAKFGYALTPGRYVGASDDGGDDEPFEERFPKLRAQLAEQFAEGEKLKAAIEESLTQLGDR